MTLDAPLLAALRRDLEERILHARIDRIHQPNRGDLLFTLRKGAVRHLLYFSADTPGPWLGLVPGAPENPASAPAFCMLLRKYLAGGRIIGLVQPSFERLLSLRVEHFDETTGLAARLLHLEFMGRRGNAVLVDADGAILDALWRTPPGGERVLEPGAPYIGPSAAGRLNPGTLARGTFDNLLAYSSERPLRELLQAKLLGLGAASIAALLAGAGVDPAKPAGALSAAEQDRIWSRLADLAERVRREEFDPRLVLDADGAPLGILAWPEPQAPGRRLEKIDDLAAAVGAFQGRAAEDRRLAGRRSSLAARIRAELARARRKLDKQEQELAAAGEADLDRTRGELLLAYLHLVPRGAGEADLPAPDGSGAMVKIPLDPALSPSENAQAYFRRYQRAKRGRTAIAAQMAKTAAELSYLRDLDFAIFAAENAADLAEIEAEMAAQGLLPRAKAGKPAPSGGPLRYRSRDGLEILVGRNNRQNEEVTFRLADPGDTWLHVREIPGAHVIVKHRSAPLSPEALLDAANLAVYHSRAREGSKVPVDYTERRHVRKQPGGRPGAVHYDHFQTVIVDPDPEILGELLGRTGKSSV